MNPKKLKAFEEAHDIKRKIRDEENFTLGQYMMSALSATVGNMFKNKTDEPNKYIEMPILQYDADVVRERELQRQREQFVQALLNAKAEFDANKSMEDSVS